MDENGQILSFPVFQSKYSSQKTTFLHYYQVVSAIPSHLLTKAKIQEFNSETINIEDPESFRLDENVTINLLKAKSKDFYWIIINVLINNDFLKHKQANINVKNRRFGVIVTPLSRQSE